MTKNIKGNKLITKLESLSVFYRQFAVALAINLKEIEVMICVTVLWIELVGASWVLSSIIADLVCAHVLREQYLCGYVNVFQPFEWNMGNDISIMDYSEHCVKLSFHELGEVCFTYSRLAKSVYFNSELISIVHLHFSTGH